MIDEFITAAMYGRQGDRLQSTCGIGLGIYIYLFYFFVMILLFMFMFMFMGGDLRIHIQVKLLVSQSLTHTDQTFKPQPFPSICNLNEHRFSSSLQHRSPVKFTCCDYSNTESELGLKFPGMEYKYEYRNWRIIALR